MNFLRALERLYFFNPWWVSGKVPEVLALPYKRDVFNRLLSYLELDRIIILKGPRRTGKTTLLYQLIDHLIKKGTRPANIVYISFDDIELRIDFDSLIKLIERILKSSLKEWQLVYLFLDEVHFLDNWELEIKRYFDRKIPVKFIISSSAASLMKKATESLMGRTIEEIILPFTFSEFLDFKTSSFLSNLLREARQGALPETLPDLTPLLPHLSDIEIIFSDYRERSGFPYIFQVEDPILWKKMLKEDIIDKVIYRDLIQLFDIKKPVTLERLFLYLSSISSGLLNISNISNSLQLSREYTEKYLEYLKRAYLIFTIRRYARNLEKQIRGNEKVYMVDHGLINAFGSSRDGDILKNIVFKYLYSLRMPLYYWRQRYEVDFVIETEKGAIPIEVKDSDDIAKKDLRGIIEFMRRYDLKRGIVVTRTLFKEERVNGRSVLFIPAIILA